LKVNKFIADSAHEHILIMSIVSFEILSLTLLILRVILRICLRSVLVSMVFLFSLRVILCVFVVLIKAATALSGDVL
jgi:hypothetical protein